MAEAAPNSDGLAVLGVLFELADESTYESQFANDFISYVKEVPRLDDHYIIANKTEFRTIRDIIKTDAKEFYTYKGLEAISLN